MEFFAKSSGKAKPSIFPISFACIGIVVKALQLAEIYLHFLQLVTRRDHSHIVVVVIVSGRVRGSRGRIARPRMVGDRQGLSGEEQLRQVERCEVRSPAVRGISGPGDGGLRASQGLSLIHI